MIMSLLFKTNFFLHHIIPVIIINQCKRNFVNGQFDLLLHWLGNKGGGYTNPLCQCNRSGY